MGVEYKIAVKLGYRWACFAEFLKMIAVSRFTKVAFVTQCPHLHQEIVAAQERSYKARSSSRDVVNANQSSLPDSLLVIDDIYLWFL